MGFNSSQVLGKAAKKIGCIISFPIINFYKMMYPLTPIKDDKQYYAYCDELERLDNLKENELTEDVEDNMEHLMILIEAWDRKHFTLPELNPVEYLKLLMENHSLKAVDLQKKTGLDKSLISHLLNYRKGFSKNTIIVLSKHFAVQQEMFSRDYELRNDLKKTRNKKMNLGKV